jgi:hypothetical protein
MATQAAAAVNAMLITLALLLRLSYLKAFMNLSFPPSGIGSQSNAS